MLDIGSYKLLETMCMQHAEVEMQSDFAFHSFVSLQLNAHRLLSIALLPRNGVLVKFGL